MGCFVVTFFPSSQLGGTDCSAAFKERRTKSESWFFSSLSPFHNREGK